MEICLTVFLASSVCQLVQVRLLVLRLALLAVDLLCSRHRDIKRLLLNSEEMRLGCFQEFLLKH